MKNFASLAAAAALAANGASAHYIFQQLDDFAPFEYSTSRGGFRAPLKTCKQVLT